MKKREFYKFLCGFLAGAGAVHANMGFAISTGVFNEPRYLGHTWSASSLWIGAAVYLVVSAVFRLSRLAVRREFRPAPN